MTFREIIESGHSKENTNRILEAIRIDNGRINELMDLFFDDEWRICQRAAWPVGYLGEKFPNLLDDFYDQMIRNLDAPKHDAVIRNTLRTWKEMDIPEQYEGEIFERCFMYVSSPNYPSAVRAFALMIATKIALKYPDLAHELIPTIEEIAPYTSSGLKNCCKNQLKILKKLSLD